MQFRSIVCKLATLAVRFRRDTVELLNSQCFGGKTGYMDSALVRGVLVNMEKIRYFHTKGALTEIDNSAATPMLTFCLKLKKKKKKKTRTNKTNKTKSRW
jgi:hypothetical protein